MPTFRAVTTFEFAQFGWSETFFMSGETLTYEQIFAEILGVFVERRRAILADTCFVRHVRISNVDPPRDARFSTIAYDAGVGLVASGATGPEPTQAAVNLRLFSGAAKWRAYLIRGLPQEAIGVNAGQQFVRNAWVTRLEPLRTWLRSGQPLMRASSYGEAVALATATLANNKLLSITTAAAIVGLVVGDTIQIRQAQGISNINGPWIVVAVGPGLSITIKPKQQFQYGTLTAGTGLVRKVTFAYQAITSTAVVGATTRRLGRPLYLPRGRRSARKG